MKKLLFAIFTLCLLAIIKANAQNKQLAPNAMVVRSSKWDQKKISVCWDNPQDLNPHFMDIVREAVTDTWQKNSGIAFTDWCPATQKNADIHIYVTDSQPKTIGFGNKIKRWPKGVKLNFSFRIWSPEFLSKQEFYIKAIAVHEFGHALGFVHEQSRVACDFNCAKDVEDIHTDRGDWPITACDPQSVMNYCNPQYSNNGILSPLDIEAVQTLYGRPSGLAQLNINAFAFNKRAFNIFPNLYPDAEAIYSSYWLKAADGMRNPLHEFKVYISGVSANFAQIQKVVYHLPATFNPQTLTATNQRDRFAIALTTDTPVKILVDIYTTNGIFKRLPLQKKTQELYLKMK